MSRKVEIEVTEHERPASLPTVSSGNRGRPLSALVEELEAKSPQVVAGAGLSSAAMRAGDLVRSMRKAAGYSQAQLAAEVGVSQSRISELESGAGSQGPTWDVMERVAQACGQIVGLIDNPYLRNPNPTWIGMHAACPPRRDLMPDWVSASQAFLDTPVTEIADPVEFANYAHRAYAALVNTPPQRGRVKFNDIQGRVYVSVDVPGSTGSLYNKNVRVIMAPVAVCKTDY
jgi:transcriptional regulator with XRE-family HTH domain